MSVSEGGRRVAPSRGRRPVRRRRRVTVTGVLGELFITAGVGTLLFLGWQLWFNDLVIGNELRDEAVQQSQSWDRDANTAAHGTTEAPPVVGVPAHAAVFANMIIPRFGAGWYKPIAEGTGTRDVLDKGEVGHYPTTQMPGELGNFAVAAHRTSHGASFNGLNMLQAGDHIYIETADGWYSYVFRNLEYVHPNGVGVVAPVPESPGTVATDRILTMTSCNPLFSAQERIIAYSVFDRFIRRADGPPDDIAATVAGEV
ncbi:class E sortase [soil metagenome]